MSIQKTPEHEVRIQARNTGGIDSTDVTLSPGVTVLTGRNATNRTSFLQAIMAALGSEKPSLKGDAEEGEVELQMGNETYTRTMTRRGDNIVFDGDPYLDDPQIADLFAFLLEDNEARQAVARGDDLREIIMRPIDTTEIETEIQSLETEKRELDSRIEQLEELENELPELESERQAIQTELETVREELSDVASAIADHDVSIEESQSQKEAIEEAFERLRQAKSDLEDTEFELDTEQAALEDLQTEREELEETLEENAASDEEPERLAGRIEELRSRQRALNDTLSQLNSVISFNEEMLEEDGLELADAVSDQDTNPSELTDQLVSSSQETVCWTCGSEVATDRIDETIDRLRDLRKEKLNERNEVQDRIDDLSTKRSTIKEQRLERERTERRLTEIEDEIAETEERVDELESAVSDQRDAVERLEDKTADMGGEYDEVLDLHQEKNELELETDRLETDLEELDEQIDEREAAIEEKDDVIARREEIADELTELRTRVDRIEEDAVESFNENMDAILSLLEYDNIDRIWIERREKQVREGRRKVDRMTFDLHVVRTTAEGTTYRDTVDHLSESEREVTGLIFALAGYLVHEVYEELPFMILDSLEAIDSDRIARIVEYFSEHVGYLVVALLPEDTTEIPDGHTYVTDI